MNGGVGGDERTGDKKRKVKEVTIDAEGRESGGKEREISRRLGEGKGDCEY